MKRGGKMKEQVDTVDKVAVLDREIENERGTIQRLEANFRRTLEEAQRAEETQKTLAYAALGEGRTEAQDGLTEAEDTLSRFQARAKSAEIALEAARQKLAALQKEREQAFRATKRCDYAAEVDQLLKTDAEQLEQALAGMAAARDAIRERLKKLDALAAQAGIDATRPHARVKENLRHCIEQRAQFDSVWMTREARAVFRQPIPQVLERTLNTIIEQPQPEQAAG
jgi:chromosome segregation ATPase